MRSRRSFLTGLSAALGLSAVPVAAQWKQAGSTGRPPVPEPCPFGCGAVASGPGLPLVTAANDEDFHAIRHKNMLVYVCTNGHLFIKHRTGY